MKSLVERLASYAQYHRDRRNLAFALGLSPELRAEVERRAGPTRRGKVASTELAATA